MASFLNNLFHTNEDKYNSHIEWVRLNKISSIAELVDSSMRSTLVIFKHSSRCGISSSVLRKFEKKVAVTANDQKLFYFVNVTTDRDVSNEISRRFNVRHESPQILIVKNNEVVRHDSHYNILSIEIADF